MFVSGRMIDLILLLVVAEAALLAWLGPRARRESLFTGIAPTLVSGALLLLAVRAALSGLWWGWVALILTLALISHGIDGSALAQSWPHRSEQRQLAKQRPLTRPPRIDSTRTRLSQVTYP